MNALGIQRQLEAVDSDLDQRNQQQGTLSPAITFSGEIWVGIHFPCLSLDVFSHENGLPMAVIDEERGRQVIHTASALALEQGIMPGMPLNAAYVLCRNLSVHPRDSRMEQKLLDSRAELVSGYTPTISCSGTDTLLLEISRSVKLFGGFESLMEMIRGKLPDNAVTGVAPVPGAAALLARNGLEAVVTDKAYLKSVLGELSISDAGCEARLVDQLGKCGLETLRDLWRMPRSDLARRFGPKLIDFLDRIGGTRADIRVRRIPRTCFYQSIELPVESESSKLVMIAVEALLHKAHQFLQSRSSATEIMIFRLWYAHPLPDQSLFITLKVRSQQADRDPGRFMPQFEERLARTDIRDPIKSVSLRIDQVMTQPRESGDLFGFRPDRSDVHLAWEQLVDVLVSRLGSRMVYQVVPDEDHRPEKAWRFCRLDGGNTGRIRNDVAEVPVPDRPCWLLDEPKKFLPNNSYLKLDKETERVEAGWWDGGDVRRDYYSATTEKGSRCWVYRRPDELNDDGVKDGEGGYYLHGFYG